MDVSVLKLDATRWSHSLALFCVLDLIALLVAMFVDVSMIDTHEEKANPCPRSILRTW